MYPLRDVRRAIPRQRMTRSIGALTMTRLSRSTAIEKWTRINRTFAPEVTCVIRICMIFERLRRLLYDAYDYDHGYACESSKRHFWMGPCIANSRWGVCEFY